MDRMKFRNGAVYDDNGYFKYSYYECGIKAGMSEKKMMELVEKWDDYLFHERDEEELKEQGLI
jgi:hypothetical protein